jgi:hypothetical protein
LYSSVYLAFVRAGFDNCVFMWALFRVFDPQPTVRQIRATLELTIDSLWIRKFTCVEYKRCPFCLLTLLLVHQ